MQPNLIVRDGILAGVLNAVQRERNRQRLEAGRRVSGKGGRQSAGTACVEAEFDRRTHRR